MKLVSNVPIDCPTCPTVLFVYITVEPDADSATRGKPTFSVSVNSREMREHLAAHKLRDRERWGTLQA